MAGLLQNLSGIAKAGGNILGQMTIPNYAYNKQMAQSRQQAAGIIGQPQQAYQMSDAELFPGEQPIQGLQTAGTGLLGGKLTPEQAYAQLLTVPGYGQYGAQGLMQQQQQQYGAQQAELDRQNAIRLQQMRGQQAIDLANQQRAAAGQKPFNQSQATAAGYANRMTASSQIMTDLTSKGFNPASTWESAKAGVPLIGNYLASPEYQQYRSAQEDWVRAKLRKESGANIPDPEMEAEIRTYFPEPGDSPERIEQKRQARARAEQSLIGESQGAYQQLFPQSAQAYQQYMQGQGSQTIQQNRQQAQQQYQQQAQSTLPPGFTMSPVQLPNSMPNQPR